MRLAVLPLLFIFAVAVAAHPVSRANSPQLNRNFDLQVGQSVKIEGTRLRVSFVSVAEDSRCPQNVECVWAGNAKVVLKLGGHNLPPSKEVSLNTGLNPKHISYQRYDIKLVAVKPPRKTPIEIPKSDYVITLIVTKS